MKMDCGKCHLKCDFRTPNGYCYSTGLCNRYYEVQDISNKPIETFMKYGKFSVSSKEGFAEDNTNNEVEE